MKHGRTFKLTTLCAVGLLATLAGTSKPARSADKSDCQLKITKFAQLAYFNNHGVTAYQFAITVWSSAPAGDVVDASGGLGGGGGENQISGLWNMTTGFYSFVAWTTNDDNADRSHKESLSLDLRCETDYGQDEQYDSAKRTIQLYRPGEAQPLVQPWVNGCPDELVVDSRGSRETLGTISPPGQVFANELRLGYYGANFYGQDYVIESLANSYPAKGDLLKYIFAKLPLPLAYRRSEAAGVKWLKRELGQVHRHCRSTDVYLSGYSQGAQITADVYQSRHWPSVRGVVMFGDLKFNPVDVSDRGNFDRSGHLPFGHLLHGYLGSRPAFGKSQVWSFCHKHDPACQGAREAGYRFKYHKYDKHGEPQLAARYFRLNS